MTDLIVIVILLAMLVPAACYVVRAKKKGQVCIGCPSSGSCHKGTCGGCNGSCGKCADGQQETHG